MTLENSREVERKVGVFDGVWLIVALMLGVGIFKTPPLIAGAVDGSLSLMGIWLLAAFLSFCGAVCYAELSSEFPYQGGDYYFLCRAFGPLIGFLFGWSQTFLIRPGSIAAIAMAGAEYLQVGAPMSAHFSIPILACALIALLTGVQLVGLKTGVRTQTTLSILGYTVLLLMIVVAMFGKATTDLAVTTPSEVSTQTDYGLALILALFCFGGWSEISLIGGEVKNPSRTIRYSLLSGISLITALYLLINVALVKALTFGGLQVSSTPFAQIFSTSSFDFSKVIAIIIVLCTLGSLSAILFTSGRLSYAFCREVSFLRLFGRWDSSRSIPGRALFMQGLLSCAFSIAAGSFSTVLVYTTAVVWLFYLAVGISLCFLRSKATQRRLITSVWGYPLTPLLFILSCILLLVSAIQYDLQGTLITFTFVISGIPVYLLNAKNGRVECISMSATAQD